MAVAKMLKLQLVGVNAEQEKLLNALHKTCAVELKRTDDIFEGERFECDKSEIIQKRECVENALSLITKTASAFGKKDILPDRFGVSYFEFTEVYGRENEILNAAKAVKAKKDETIALGVKKLSLKTELNGYLPYEALDCKFSDFTDTLLSRVRFGIASDGCLRKINEGLNEQSLVVITEHGSGSLGTLVSVICHESVISVVDRVLGESGFIKCPYGEDVKPEYKIRELREKIEQTESKIQALNLEIVNFSESVKDLKLLSDHYLFIMEKAEGSDGFLRTKNTFLLEAFVPAERRDEVAEAIRASTSNVYFDFVEIKEGEYAPTLMKNKSVSRQFEFVTNLYSAPKYGEFDPNGVLAVFFSVFLGFITADFVYGLLMTVGGFLFAKRSKRETGVTKLARVLAYSGIPTMLFGLAFDSFLGIPLLRNLNIIQNAWLPDPIADKSILAGISVPTLLLICLGMGAVHIMVGLFINALIKFRNGKVLDGICDGIVWMVFLLGLILLVLGMLDVLPNITQTAIWIIVCSVAIGALTAGRNVKGIGKFTKAFGAVYGLINYMSDLLSYARLYGLMLSGAQIASIMSNDLALPMLKSPGGVVGVIACVLIMFIGHAFNIAMGLLGGFIHDARLQYVEFFSRFYEGEGELFTPIGTKFEHVYLK